MNIWNIYIGTCDAPVNNISKFNFYLIENILCPVKNTDPLILFKEIITLYTEIIPNISNTLFGQNAEFYA
jgi:hypothetical protein